MNKRVEEEFSLQSIRQIPNFDANRIKENWSTSHEKSFQLLNSNVIAAQEKPECCEQPEDRRIQMLKKTHTCFSNGRFGSCFGVHCHFMEKFIVFWIGDLGFFLVFQISRNNELWMLMLICLCPEYSWFFVWFST